MATTTVLSQDISCIMNIRTSFFEALTPFRGYDEFVESTLHHLSSWVFFLP
ncbi:hypothetical protein V6Z11_D09G217200 [Gossypium hirsutum]